MRKTNEYLTCCVGKTILITGRSSGIGFEIPDTPNGTARNVVMVAPDSQRLDQAKTTLTARRGHSNISMSQCDIGDSDSVRRMAPEVVAAAGRSHIPINKAGLAHYYSFDQMSEDEIEETATVLSKIPKHLQAKAKFDFHRNWMAETREGAHHAFAAFIKVYQPKYPKAAECLARDKNPLLSFYDFPPEHWHHIRSSNPIQSTFAGVGLCTAKTRGCGLRTTIVSTLFKLSKSAEQWRLKLRGVELTAEVVTPVQFKNGVEVQKAVRQEHAA